jgi:HEAT repeat protein
LSNWLAYSEVDMAQEISSGTGSRPGRGWFIVLILACVGAVALFFWKQGHHLSQQTVITSPSNQPPVITAQPANPAEAETQRVPAGDLAAARLAEQVRKADFPMSARRKAARSLAAMGSEEAMAASKKLLEEAPSVIKAALAEGFGKNPHPEARRILLELVDGPDALTAHGAIQGLAYRGDSEAATVLGNILNNTSKPEALRSAAALGLGEIPLPEALTALLNGASQVKDQAMMDALVEGIAKRPYAETESFFQEYLGRTDLGTEAKVSALEALGTSTGDASSLLLRYAADSNAEVRSAAAWALATTTSEADLGRQLVGLLDKEPSAEVRTRLYQALGGQETLDGAAILRLTQNENDAAARLAGFELLARSCGAGASTELLSFFNERAVPELKSAALSGGTPNRLASVLALRNAGTPESLNALQEIGRLSTDAAVVRAAQAAVVRR